MYPNFSFSITLVMFMKSHVMPNVYPLQNCITFVAICFKYSYDFQRFSPYSVSAHTQKIGKFQMFEIFLSYINLWWLNTFAYYYESSRFAISYCFQLFGPSVNLRSGKVCSTLSG